MAKKVKIFYILLFLLASPVFLSFNAWCQQTQTLDEGIDLYKAEKYDEAVNVFTKAREADPKSSTAAFFLGMAYKQLMDYEEAEGPLQDAVTLTPKIKEALIELIEVDLRLGKLEEAKECIAVAEQEGIKPADTAFLKGLVLTQEGKNQEAAASFAKAKSLDPEIAQASDIQIALSHLRDSEFDGAKEAFQSAITVDPQTDLAGFARQYLASVDEAIFARKPFHFTASLFGQYDDNMVLKPTDESLATGVTDEGSAVLNSSFKVSYSPKINGPWLFNSYYSIASGLHKENKDTHDSLANTISMTPGYNFGKVSLNLSATYSYFMVRRPDYEKYSGKLTAGPMLRWAVQTNQLLEVFAGYNNDKYYEDVFFDDEVRTSTGLSSYLSWVWLFKENSFLNLRYNYEDKDAEGANWDNTSHGLSANVVIPVGESVKVQFSGQYTKKAFANTHTIFDVKRDDKIFNLIGGVSWEFYKDLSLVGQYTRIDNGSNIGIYDYTRNLYTLGLEYRF